MGRGKRAEMSGRLGGAVSPALSLIPALEGAPAFLAERSTLIPQGKEKPLWEPGFEVRSLQAKRLGDHGLAKSSEPRDRRGLLLKESSLPAF